MVNRMQLRQNASCELPAKSFERFLLDIGITQNLADVTCIGSGREFTTIPVRGIDTRVERLFVLFVPSLDGQTKEYIRVSVGSKMWVLLYVEYVYAVGEFVVHCMDATPTSNEYAVVPLTVPFLRKRMGLEIRGESPEFYPPPREERWLQYMWKALFAGKRAR